MGRRKGSEELGVGMEKEGRKYGRTEGRERWRVC